MSPQIPQRRTLPLALLALVLASALPGCAWLRNICGVAPPPPACVLAPDAPPEVVVAHLNENTAKIMGWRADGVGIRMIGVPFGAHATIAIESPRNLRIKVGGAAGEEADIGSNSEQFWFWTKRNNDQRRVLLARHDDDPEKMKRFPFPFQPDWIMEVLGVMPIDLDGVTTEPGPLNSNTLILRSDRVSPQGFPVRRVTVVDTCLGVVREHALYDLRSPEPRPIARARLSGHHCYAPSQAMLPSRIELEWPQTGEGMTMTFPNIVINPQRSPQQQWMVPNFTGYTVYDLGAAP